MARFWLLASCLTLLYVRNAFPKIVEGTLSTTENWAFIAKALFLRSIGQLKYHFEYPSTYATQNILMYFDTQWPRVYPQPSMKCLDREDKVLSGNNQVINLTTSYIWSGCNEKDVQGIKYLICDGDRHFRSGRERWWYIAMSNCKSLKGLSLKYKLEFTNGRNADNQSSTIKCHHCTSTKSWEDCERVHGSSTADCTQSDAVCYKIHYATNGGISQYAKSCEPKTYCQQKENPICKDHAGSTKCDIDCCDDDLCNAGSIIGVSIRLVAAGVLVAMLLVKT